MKDSTRTELAKTLAMIGDKVGGKTIILYAHDDGEIFSGGIITGDTDYESACKMSVEMTNFISEAFGQREQDEIDS